MAQSKHKYRVSVYLGKDLYNDMEQIAEVLGLSIASVAKLMLDNGFAFAKTLERSVKEYGNK